MVFKPLARNGPAYTLPNRIKPSVEPKVNHQAEKPALTAPWAVPTVAEPPTIVPTSAPATSHGPDARPPTLKFSKDDFCAVAKIAIKTAAKARKIPPQCHAVNELTLPPVYHRQSILFLL